MNIIKFEEKLTKSITGSKKNVCDCGIKDLLANLRPLTSNSLTNFRIQKKIISERNPQTIAQSTKIVFKNHLLECVYCSKKGYCSKRCKNRIKDNQISEFNSYSFFIDNVSIPSDLKKQFSLKLSSKSRRKKMLPYYRPYMSHQTQ